MVIEFDEQDIVDAVCVVTAMRQFTQPENVDVELLYNELADNFSAQVEVRGSLYNRKTVLSHAELFDVVQVFLQEDHNFDAEHVQVTLQFSEDEGISASAEILR